MVKKVADKSNIFISNRKIERVLDGENETYYIVCLICGFSFKASLKIDAQGINQDNLIFIKHMLQFHYDNIITHAYCEEKEFIEDND